MTKSPNRLLALVFGAVYLLIGILGFTITTGTDFAATDGPLLLGIFEVNPLHNVVHLAIGAGLLIAGLASVRAAKAANTTVGAVYLLVGVLGLFIIGSPLNILALNSADNVLHFASAAVLLAVGLGAERRSTTRATV